MWDWLAELPAEVRVGGKGPRPGCLHLASLPLGGHSSRPYTFILEGTRLVPKIMLTKRKTVGIRVPDNNICLTILRTFGRPIISTSAGYDEPQSIREAYGSFLDVIVDGGVLYQNPSSLVSLIGDVPEVIREGKGNVSSFR